MLKKIVLNIILSVIFATAPVAAQSGLSWKEVNREIDTPTLVDPASTDGVELYVQQGSILVRTNRRVQIRVFTILGQLVSQAIVNPGVSELKMNSRGIYLVKIGNITQKVAL